MQNFMFNKLFSKEVTELMSQLKSHDHHSYIHSLRTTAYYIGFCQHFSLDHCLTTETIYSVLLHDIGKIHVPAKIIQKKTMLSKEEWMKLQKHPACSLVILRESARVPINPAIVLYHHKNIDGSGYPIQNEDIALNDQVRILRIIDSFEAMTAERPYGKTFTTDEALHELTSYIGEYYDPHFVTLFQKYAKSGSFSKEIEFSSLIL